MADKPQMYFRGLVTTRKLIIGSSGNTAGLTVDSTAVLLSVGVKLNNSQTLTGNSTAIVHGNPESALPSTDNGAAWTIISNSTGVAVAVNTTGTTWKYLNVTSVQPT